MVTAGHVLKPEHRLKPSTLWIHSKGGKWSRAVFEAADDHSDIGIAIVEDPHCETDAMTRNEIRFEPVEALEPVVCSANTSHSDKFLVTSGLVASPRQTFSLTYADQPFGLIQIAMSILPGMSGAPLFDSNQKLCGMITKKYSEFGLAIPSNVLLAKVDQLIEDGHCKRRPFGIRFAQRLCLYPVNGSFRPGIELTSVDLDSLAYHGGLQSGDVILTVNGEPCMAPCDIIESTEIPIRVVRLEYLRGGVLLRSELRL